MQINNVNKDVINKAAEIIKSGGVVCFPTETVYALACSSDNDQAIRLIYQIKGRDFNKPLSLLVADIGQIEEVAEVIPTAKLLLDKFAPGPLTIILNKKLESCVSSLVGTDNTIGVRVPDHPIALAIIKAVGKPIIATSANISGSKEAINAQQVEEQLEGKIDFIIDAGNSLLKMSSTVVDLTGKEIKIIRQGTITEIEISSVIKSNNI